MQENCSRHLSGWPGLAETEVLCHYGTWERLSKLTLKEPAEGQAVGRRTYLARLLDCFSAWLHGVHLQKRSHGPKETFMPQEHGCHLPLQLTHARLEAAADECFHAQCKCCSRMA